MDSVGFVGAALFLLLCACGGVIVAKMLRK